MLFAIPSASFGCINAMLHQTFLFLGQLWQLFEVSQILEFLRYYIPFNAYFIGCDIRCKLEEFIEKAHGYNKFL